MTDTGWAAGDWPRRHLLAYQPLDDDDGEPPYAVVDAWEPPEPLALPQRVCDRILAAAEAAVPSSGSNGAYLFPDLEPADERSVLKRFGKANTEWWNLDLDRWDVMVKRYGPGDRHARHQDLHPGAARRNSPAPSSSRTPRITRAATWSCTSLITASPCPGRAGRS